MRSVAGWTEPAEYSLFLAMQLRSRAGIELWLGRHAPKKLSPPPQCSLIADDLGLMDTPYPTEYPAFEPSAPTDHPPEAAVLGVAWVLAGSSLGNRAILHDLRRNGHADWPHAFLGDNNMLAFWNDLRPMIEVPANIETVKASVAAAQATFAHFIDVATKGPNEAIGKRSENDPDQLLKSASDAEVEAVLVKSSKSTARITQASEMADDPADVPIIDAPIARGKKSQAIITRPEDPKTQSVSV